MFKKYGIPAITTVVLGALYFYIALPVLNPKSSSFWGFLIVLAIFFFLTKAIVNKKGVFSGLFKEKNKKGKIEFINPPEKDSPKKKNVKKIVLIVGGIALVIVGVLFVTSSKMFNADKYQKMLTVVESDFYADIAEIPISNIPVVDRDSAEILGNKTIDPVVELVSQFEVSSYYTQINYQNKPVRVSPLEYADIFKWFSNKGKGIPYYVRIDMATQEKELVELPEGMKYAPCECFQRDLTRHIRFAYPTKMIDSISFEIDESGHPYWIVSCYDYTIGLFGGYDITGIIMVDAVSGDMDYYDVGKIPQWVDQVYNANVILKQANYWGAYKNGYINSLISQKNVVKTSDGYNYLAINDDIWVYTGITSVVSDKSNIGFILVNLRTKEAKTYAINGAEEYSAMKSAQGKIQEKGYTATFPILLNVADTPSYFISLKDEEGLVKAYSFVSVADYQIVGVADTLTDAEAEYRRLLKESGKLSNTTEPEKDTTLSASGAVTAISSAVIDGNTCYYIKIADSDKIFIVDVLLYDELPFVKEGDLLEITYLEKGNEISIQSVKIGVPDGDAATE